MTAPAEQDISLSKKKLPGRNRSFMLFRTGVATKPRRRRPNANSDGIQETSHHNPRTRAANDSLALNSSLHDSAPSLRYSNHTTSNRRLSLNHATSDQHEEDTVYYRPSWLLPVVVSLGGIVLLVFIFLQQQQQQQPPRRPHPRMSRPKTSPPKPERTDEHSKLRRTTFPNNNNTTTLDKQKPAKRSIQGNSKEGTQCLISSTGVDGLGHQIEAKLSCLASAIELHHFYVHLPLTELHHGIDPQEMEELFGMDGLVDKFPHHIHPYNGDAMEVIRPISTFDCVAEAKRKATSIDRLVLASDNCFDHFWRHAHQLSQANTVYDAFGFVRQQLMDGIARDWQRRGKTNPTLLEESTTIQMAMHIRLGDAGARKSNLDWCQQVVQKLAEAAQRTNRSAHLVIHTDGSRAELESHDDGLWLRGVAPHFLITLHTKDESTDVTLTDLLYDFLTADLFIGALSSLSNVPLLLTDFSSRPSILPWDPFRIQRSRVSGWNVLDTDDGGALKRCVTLSPTQERKVRRSMDHGCFGHWESPVSNLFWDGMVNEAIDHARERKGKVDS